MQIYAHTKKDSKGELSPQSEWEPLFSEDCETLTGGNCEKCQSLDPQHGHLNKVAFLAGKFAAEMFPEGSDDSKTSQKWGYLAGLWHDLGKFSDAFQQRIRGSSIKADHSTAGAQLAKEIVGLVNPLVGYPIMGHHAGLSNYQGSNASFSERLADESHLAAAILAAQKEISRIKETTNVPLNIPSGSTPNNIAFFIKMLFSCLVDADFLATEKFCSEEKTERRNDWSQSIIEEMYAELTEAFAKFPKPEPDSLNAARAAISADCISAAERPIGFHSLTVPTGGGKTLSSLGFALKHAIKHNLRRVVYVIPYTSIIEQNAEVFRKTFAQLSDREGMQVVLEHHSNFDSESNLSKDEKPVYQLTCENWNAPLIVTTNVQFFESLAHQKTSRCRKLHNLARSVIIFDEAQSLPPDHLHPCLDFLKRLVATYQSSVVLCTATQPALNKLPEGTVGDFAKAFNEIALPVNEADSEITKNTNSLFATFKRTRLHILDTPIPDEALVERIRSSDRSLTILNTKPHASKVFTSLDPEDTANLHLSAQLTPAHRRVILSEIHRREKLQLPCRLVSTTVVEAGVDISFPILYRAFSGIDSLAQALGRCNRHGELVDAIGKPALGDAYFFECADQKTPDFLKYAVSATRTVLKDQRFKANPDTLLSPEAIKAYFRNAYWLHGGLNGEGWDKPDYRNSFKKTTNGLPFLLNFRTFSEAFQMIPDNQTPIIIEPHPDYMPDLHPDAYTKIPSLLDRIRSADRQNRPPPPNAHRALQSFTIQIPKQIHSEMVRTGEIQTYCDGRFPILTHPKALYDKKLGLELPKQVYKRNPQAYIM
jgi:CRISPR-associated endonuclease/helicase Cas3